MTCPTTSTPSSDGSAHPSLVICLDSGCADYDHLWITTSFRGLLAGQLDVAITSEGVHSGDASGVVPSTFRIARQILSRIEDENPGEIVLDDLHVPIPPERIEELKGTSEVLALPLAGVMPFLEGARPVTDDPAQQLINHTWKPMLEITGADGLPPCDRAGNVLPPEHVALPLVAPAAHAGRDRGERAC